MNLHELLVSDGRGRGRDPGWRPNPTHAGKRSNSTPPGAATPHKQHQATTSNIIEKGFQSITLGEENDIPSIHHTTKNLADFTPPIESDPRRKRAAIIFPRDIPKYPDMFRIHNLKLDMTWKGRDCFSCKHVSGSHTLINTKLVIIGDQYLPATVGSGTDCIPVLRIEDGTFEAVKQALWSQRNIGFRTVEGAVYAVSLQAFLCRAGSENFWNGFDDLDKWVRERMGGILAPFFMPYGLLNDEMLSKMQQCLTVMRARYLGDLVSRPVWRYSLWQPLFKFFTEHAVIRRSVQTAVSMVTLPNGSKITVEGAQRSYQGILGDFKKEYPEEFELDFILKLLNHIENVAPPVMLPISPTLSALEKGFNREDDREPALLSDRPTLYLYGNSILKETGKMIDEQNLSITHKLVMNCKGGDIAAILRDHPVPAATHNQDLVILHFIGNISLNFAKFGKPDSNWHYLHPKILEDNEVAAIVDKIIDVVNLVRKTYKGKLKVVGPLPRLVGECCKDHDHRLTPPFPFTASPEDPVISYYAALNQYLVCHPKLATIGAEIVPYQLIWMNKGGFGERSLRDNLHLKDEALKIFADFIIQLTAWKEKSYKLMDYDAAFRTWVALFYGWAKKSDAVQDPTQAGASGTAGRSATAAGQATNNTRTSGAGKELSASGAPTKPPAPPNMPPKQAESMDHSNTAADSGEATETISEFLEKTANKANAKKADGKRKNKK